MKRRTYKNLSSEDRAIRDCLDRAQREVENAIRMASSMRGGRASRTTRELASLHRGLQDVGAASFESSDPDLTPESERNAQHRRKLREERRKSSSQRRGVRNV